MISHTEKGRQFQEKCRDALGLALGRKLELNVAIALPEGRTHKFDLATPEQDVVAECKAVAWTSSGNVPAAKIVHLKEAIQYLRSLSGRRDLYLIVKRDTHPRTKETLATYFARLNKDLLSSVKILELPEEGGSIKVVHGETGESRSTATLLSPRDQMTVTAGDMGEMRRLLFKLLDWRESRQTHDEGPSKRVSRLRAEGKVPRHIANLMHTVLGFRNVAEYESYTPTAAETIVITSAWQAIVQWAESQGWRP